MSITTPKVPSLIDCLAERQGVASDTYYDALIRVPFAQCKNISREEMAAVLLVAKKLDLDPFAKEIYAVPGRYENAPITPVIGYDGWMKILQRQPTYDGMEAFPSEKMITPEGFSRPVPEYCEVVIYDKRRSHPVRVREYFEEVKRVKFSYNNSGQKVANASSPWVSMPWRMLRAKTIIQGVRNAYPVGGFEDSSELETDPEFVEVLVPVEKSKPVVAKASRKASMKVSKPGFPTIDDKDALMNLLDHLVVRVSKTDAPEANAIRWIESKIAASSQSFAIQYVREKLNPQEETLHQADEFDLDFVETVQPQEVTEAKPSAKAVPTTVNQSQSVEQVIADDPLGGPDADCYGLESFSDDIDIDAI